MNKKKKHISDTLHKSIAIRNMTAKAAFLKEEKEEDEEEEKKLILFEFFSRPLLI